jgi:phosphomannomutase
MRALRLMVTVIVCSVLPADGSVVDGDELLFIIAMDRVRRGGIVEGVVGTQMTNLGMEQGLAEHGISLARASVGDRHVLAGDVAKGLVTGWRGLRPYYLRRRSDLLAMALLLPCRC